jgi:hypothetical protein
MDLPHLVEAAGVKEYTLGYGGLPRIDMRDDSDVASFGNSFIG